MTYSRYWLASARSHYLVHWENQKIKAMRSEEKGCSRCLQGCCIRGSPVSILYRRKQGLARLIWYKDLYWNRPWGQKKKILDKSQRWKKPRYGKRTKALGIYLISRSKIHYPFKKRYGYNIKRRFQFGIFLTNPWIYPHYYKQFSTINNTPFNQYTPILNWV